MGTRTDSLIVDGPFRCQSIIIPDNSVNNATVDITANIAASKLEHTHRKTYAQTGTAAADAGRVIHVVNGATARNLYVRAGSIVAALGGATVTIDLKKNGTSIMTGGTPITLDNANTAYTSEDLIIATTTAVAGDVFSVVVTATTGGGTLPSGVYLEFEIDEVATA